MKVLVTGGAGFIGSNLVRRLVADGHEVRVIDNFATGYRHNIEDLLADIELIEGDLQSYERAHTAVKGCEVVFHQAALPSVPRSMQDPLTTSAVNITGTLNVLLCARDEGVRRVVYASSSSAYGNSEHNPRREDQCPAPIAPYAVAKLAAEHYCQSFARVYGLETVCLRYFNVFGPRQDPASQYSAVIPRFVSAVAAGQAPIVFGDGLQTRDFTYVDNVVDANVLAANAAVATATMVNVAGGHGTSVRDLALEIAACMHSDIQPRFVEARIGDVRDSIADISKAREVLGYEPRVPVHEGIARTVEWLQGALRASAPV